MIPLNIPWCTFFVLVLMPPAFERRIPSNPKYAAIRSVIDTGATARLDKPVHSDQQISRIRSELFKRVRNSRIAELIRAVQANEGDESIYDLVQSFPDPLNDSVSVAHSVESLGAKSIGVVSFVDSAAAGAVTSRDVLIVDLREPDDYSRSRILFAINHPATLITRDVFHPSLGEFKRKVPKKYLLVYHSDEKHSARFASLLVEKGWDEVFIGQGGFEEFKNSYPELIDEDNTN
jgi:rhodanese-related sulfurtransferase